jgi:hypothetical protein
LIDAAEAKVAAESGVAETEGDSTIGLILLVDREPLVRGPISSGLEETTDTEGRIGVE